MSKFIDLADEIMAEIPNDLDPLVVRTLRWLDRHPEKVPGRTITESQYKAWIDDSPRAYRRGFEYALILANIDIIPDRELTNAEKLKSVLDDIGDSSDEYRAQLARVLDAAGVKAPGDDNE